MSHGDLPSLAALRAFEAAARHGSYSAAARDLNVTHAAVAQHVRTLETHFGTRLMERAGKGMALTADGLSLARALEEGFGVIATACRDLMDRGRDRPLRIALTPSFAAVWLMPRLGKFWERHPDIALELLPSAQPVDLRAEGIDLAIRYGRGPWPGTVGETLMSAAHVAVGDAKKYAGRAGGCLADFSGETWLFDMVRNEERIWAQANGIDLDSERIRLFDTADQAREAAKAGIGVAILPQPIVRSELESGRLVLLCQGDETALAYHLLTRPGTVNPSRDLFARWLRQEARA